MWSILFLNLKVYFWKHSTTFSYNRLIFNALYGKQETCLEPRFWVLQYRLSKFCCKYNNGLQVDSLHDLTFLRINCELGGGHMFLYTC